MTIRQIIIAGIIAVMSSCSPAEGPESKDIMLSDIVTVVSSTQAEGTTFTFRRYDDLPTITLSAPDFVTSKIEAGKRALLYYYPADGGPYSSGRIKVRSLQAVNTDDIRIVPATDVNWSATPVWVNSIWRSGTYLNMRLRLSHSAKPRKFYLLADESTADGNMPELYLVHDLDGEQGSYLRDAIASFDISDIWNRSGCRGIILHVNDTNLKQDTYYFYKQP